MSISEGNKRKPPLRYLIIGAGMAGLLAGIKAKQSGDSFAIYEKGSKVGGTWAENTYPGLACDTPSHSYNFSFLPNPEWSAFLAPGPEIREYFERAATHFEIMQDIHFNSEVTHAAWRDGRWHIRTADGREDEGEILIAATGVLHHPSVPDIPGLETFEGDSFHSARWDHSVPLDGKRIGVIGSGSTGIQIVSALAGRAERLVHFQRTPQWVLPAQDFEFSEEQKEEFRTSPEKMIELVNNSEVAALKTQFENAIIDKDSPHLAGIEAMVSAHLETAVQDETLREQLRPTYRAACKRLVISNRYYPAVQKPGVVIETGRIAQVEPKGVRMEDGTFYELDVLALATGFHADRFVRPMTIEGENGASLEEFWAERPRAYFALTVPSFPNLFLLNGPTGPVGNFSLTEIAETQWEYVEQLIDEVREHGGQGVAPTAEALNSYEEARDAAAANTVWATGCDSWYLDSRGIPAVWPYSRAYFDEVMSKPDMSAFRWTDR